MNARVLIIEDNEDLAFGLQRNLEFEGYEVQVASDGTTGLEEGAKDAIDLIVLDLMLPGINGLEVLQRLREQDVDTPVLILTAKDEELDKVRGLRTGADDYLTKPFAVLELVARVEALLRRAGSRKRTRAVSRFEFADIIVDVDARSISKAGIDVPVAPREFGLLIALLKAGGAAVSRQDLLRDVWGHKAQVETRTIDTHIGELRKKLEQDPSHPRHILTVRKFGYRLDAEHAD